MALNLATPLDHDDAREYAKVLSGHGLAYPVPAAVEQAADLFAGYRSRGVGQVAETETLGHSFGPTRTVELAEGLTRQVGGWSVRVSVPLNMPVPVAFVMAAWCDDAYLVTRRVTDRFGRQATRQVRRTDPDGTVTETTENVPDEVVRSKKYGTPVVRYVYEPVVYLKVDASVLGLTDRMAQVGNTEQLALRCFERAQSLAAELVDDLAELTEQLYPAEQTADQSEHMVAAAADAAAVATDYDLL